MRGKRKTQSAIAFECLFGSVRFAVALRFHLVKRRKLHRRGVACIDEHQSMPIICCRSSIDIFAVAVAMVATVDTADDWCRIIIHDDDVMARLMTMMMVMVLVMIARRPVKQLSWFSTLLIAKIANMAQRQSSFRPQLWIFTAVSFYFSKNNMKRSKCHFSCIGLIIIFTLFRCADYENKAFTPFAYDALYSMVDAHCARAAFFSLPMDLANSHLISFSPIAMATLYFFPIPIKASNGCGAHFIIGRLLPVCMSLCLCIGCLCSYAYFIILHKRTASIFIFICICMCPLTLDRIEALLCCFFC